MRSFYSLYPSVSMIYNVVAFYFVHYKVSKICSLSYFCWCTSNQLCRLILGVIWHFLCVWLFYNKTNGGDQINQHLKCDENIACCLLLNIKNYFIYDTWNYSEKSWWFLPLLIYQCQSIICMFIDFWKQIWAGFLKFLR